MSGRDQRRRNHERDDTPRSPTQGRQGSPGQMSAVARRYGAVQRTPGSARDARPPAPGSAARTPSQADLAAALLGREPAPQDARPDAPVDRLRAIRLHIEGALLGAYREAVLRLDGQAMRAQARHIAHAMEREARAVTELTASAPGIASDVSGLRASQRAFRTRVLRALGPGFGAPAQASGEEDIEVAVRLEYRQTRRLVDSARLMIRRLERTGSADEQPAGREGAPARSRDLCAHEIERWAAQSPAYVLFLQHALQRAGRFSDIASAAGKEGKSVAYMTVAALDSLGGPPRTVAGMFLQLGKLRASWVSEAPDHAGIVAGLRDILLSLGRMCDRERFDALRGQAGFGTQTLQLAFGAADSVRALERLARLGRGGPERGGLWDAEVGRLQVAREPLEIVAGERPLAGSTIAAIDRASHVTLGAYGALFGAIVTGGALVELGPALLAEAELLCEAGRWAHTWALASPAAATEVAAFFTGLGLEMADAGVAPTLERMSTIEGATMLLAEILAIRAGAGDVAHGPRQGTQRAQPQRGADPGRARKALDELHVQAEALRNWAREHVDSATAGALPEGGSAPVPGRSFAEHLGDARQQNLLRRRQDDQGRGRARHDASERPSRRLTRLTDAEHAPDPLARPGGKATTIREQDNARTQRGLRRENAAAETLARNGYDVEQNPSMAGDKNPDYLINGKVFDCYTPEYGKDAKRIFGHVQEKVDDEQARRVLLNLDDSNIRIPRLIQEFSMRRGEVPRLEEVLAVRKGRVVRIYPVPASKMKKSR